MCASQKFGHSCLRRLGRGVDVLLVLLDVVGKEDKGFPCMENVLGIEREGSLVDLGCFEHINVAGTHQPDNPPKRANIIEGGRGNMVLSNHRACRVSKSGIPFFGIVKGVFDNRKTNLLLASGKIWMTKAVRTIACKLVYDITRVLEV